MTVAELIELLKEMPQDALAVVRGYESGYDDIGKIRRIVIKEKDEIWRSEREEWLKKKESSKETGGWEDSYFSSGPGWYDGWYDDMGKSFAKIIDGIEAVFIEQDTDNNWKREEDKTQQWYERNKEKVTKPETEIKCNSVK